MRSRNSLAPQEIVYPWSDAWLLMAVQTAGGGSQWVDLRSIISAGDYINHAILGHEEIAGGAARLIAGGWIEAKDLTFRSTKKLKDILGEKRLSIRKQWDLIHKALDTGYPNSKNTLTKKHNKPYPGLTKTVYKMALDDYYKKSG